MKFGCSLEMVNMRTSGPNFIYKQSKGFWLNYFKYIAAAGFMGIEIPYNPFSSDPMAFEIGRCGVPVSRSAVANKYGSPSSFVELLNEYGIEKIVSAHVNANDAMLECNAVNGAKEDFFNLFSLAAKEGADFLAEVGGETLVVSPTPEQGWIRWRFGDTGDRGFMARIEDIVADITKYAAAKGIKTAVTNQFWSAVRGKNVEPLLDATGALFCPDIAHLMIAGENPLDLIQNNAGRIGIVKLTDTDFVDLAKNYLRVNAEIAVDGAQRMFADLGDGKADLAGVYALLNQIGYDGWVMCESRKTLNVYRALLKLRWYVDHVITRA